MKNIKDAKSETSHSNAIYVRNPEGYIYSSASDYAGKGGIIDIELL